MEKPTVSLRDWIYIGAGDSSIAAVVCHISPDGKSVEVVFDNNQPTNLTVKWVDGHWTFDDSPDHGGYADRYTRLAEFVSILKRGPSFS